MTDNAGGARSGGRAPARRRPPPDRRSSATGPSVFTAAERRRGYREALAAAGIGADPALERVGARRQRLRASSAARELLLAADPPTALFTAQNLITIGAIRALRERGAQHEIGARRLRRRHAGGHGRARHHGRRAGSVRARPARGRAALLAARRLRRGVPAGRAADASSWRAAPGRSRRRERRHERARRRRRRRDRRGADRPRARARRQPRRAPGRRPVQRRPHDRPARAARALPRPPLDGRLRDAPARRSSRPTASTSTASSRRTLRRRSRWPSSTPPAPRSTTSTTTGTSAPGLTLGGRVGGASRARRRSSTSGRSGLVFEPMATTLEALVARMGDDTLVALDPNCRPSMIDDPAAFRGRLGRLLARTDVMKASEEDLAWIDPGADPVDRRARAARSGPRRGARDARRRRRARGHRGAKRSRCAPPRSRWSTRSAPGDAFMGAFLARWRDRGLGRWDLAPSRRGRAGGDVRLPRGGDHVLPRGRRPAAPGRALAPPGSPARLSILARPLSQACYKLRATPVCCARDGHPPSCSLPRRKDTLWRVE